MVVTVPQVPSLKSFSNSDFPRGRSRLIEAMWIATQRLFVSSWLPGSAHRRLALRAFGAKIGRGVVIKPGVRIKFPWRLSIGQDSWIGENVWIDNLDTITIGSDCCVSQGAYLCTGSHDWGRETFDLVIRPIHIESGAWIAAQAVIGPGVTIGEGAVLGLGSVATNDLNPWTIHQGNPATPVKPRNIKKAPSQV